MKKSQKESWQSYVSSINSRIPLNRIFNKIKKINGNFSPAALPILKQADGSLVSDVEQISDMFGEALSRVSRGSQVNEFQRIKETARPIRFDGGENEDYNMEISMEELQYALSQSKAIAA